MTQELCWNPNRDILENEAAEALHLILSDDGQLAARVEAELSDALGLLDAYLALFIRLLQRPIASRRSGRKRTP